ncbi:MAG: hypothetical protein ACLFPA_13450, partial [Dichotomicrobium sp.]
MSRQYNTTRQIPDHGERTTRRIVELIDSYLRHLRNSPSQEASDYGITMIARSPASPVAGALAAKAGELGRQQVSARLIFAKPAPTEVLDEVLHAVKPVLRGERISARVRWARNPGLLDAHEQMTLGAGTCWSGDAMRRSPQRPDALEIVEEDSPGAVRRAALAFSALWAASKPLDQGYFSAEKRRAFDTLSELAMAVHRRESG